MNHTFPTAAQKRVIWTAATALACTLLAAVVVLAGWLLTQLLGLLYPVLLPLGCAAIVAYILDPVVDVMEKGRWSRATVLMVLLATLGLLAVLFLIWVVPLLLSQIFQLVSEFPETMLKLQASADTFFIRHPELRIWLDQSGPKLEAELPQKIWENLHKAWVPLAQVFGWLGTALGFLFVPLYVYYFLLEKKKIAAQWRNYVPMHQSPWRDEVVLVLSEINRYLIVFFRGQVMVGLGIGLMTFIGLLIIGLPYALLIGLIAGTLSLIPYLGVICSLIPALLVAVVSGGGWEQPVLVLAVFAVVQLIEGFVLSPWIIGDRTGLHPLTVIVGILVWSLILPGLLGPILAVPLTATLRVLMYRYVWLKTMDQSVASDSK